MNALRFALRIISGKIIFNFGFQESLRTFLKPFFTGGVATANSSYSAAFCESAALRERVSLDTVSYTHLLAAGLGEGVDDIQHAVTLAGAQIADEEMCIRDRFIAAQSSAAQPQPEA